ncbi:MAG: VCBS repeat-containing protein [Acidobacteriales bacterium]|nr:VCBS repeat-containing protein [Terriglobales bacterium]
MRRTLFFTVAVLSMLLCLAFTAAAQLENRASVSVKAYPVAIATGDFNKDGAQDVAAVCSQQLCGLGIEVLMGHGDGTFASPVLYATGDRPDDAIAVADFNQDGNLDIAAPDFLDSNVTVLLGNGDGTFRPPILSAGLDSVTNLSAGDFNNDGVVDLALAGSEGDVGCLTILLGNGDGTFRPPLSMSVPGYVLSQAVADLNADGNLDVVWGYTGAQVLLGNGNGTFRLGQIYTFAGVGDGIALGDLNGDGILDIASAGNFYADVLLGNGDGTFGRDMKFPLIEGGGTTQIADMNGDGIPDVVFEDGGTDYTSQVAIVLGHGDGTFGPENFFPSGQSDSDLLTVDVNGDRQPDVLVADYFGNAVESLLNTGVIAFFPTTRLDFRQQLVGTTSPSQTVTLTNNGAKSLGISSITVSGPGLAIQNNCGQRVAAGGSCDIPVHFQPLGIGSVQGAVTLVDTASSKPQVIPITATGTVINVSPTLLRFGTQKVGTHSAPQDVALTNTGTQTVPLTSIDVTTTNYTQTNTCGTQIAAGASCTISITFAPTVGGHAIATLNVNDNGGSSPQQATLQGRGTK